MPTSQEQANKERLAKEHALGVAAQEKRQKEYALGVAAQEKQRAEKFRKKLIALGIDPDSID